MPIYLHPIDEEADNPQQIDWVEIDLVSWKSGEKDYPHGISLVRRLSNDTKEPYLQELMFASLNEGLPVKQLTLELPNNPTGTNSDTYQFDGIKVIDYTLHPRHSHHHKAYEKVSFVAKTKAVNKI